MGNKTISKNSIIVLFLLHLSFIVFLPQSAYSWGLRVHTDAARDAANLIPNNFYVKHWLVLLVAVTEPDENRVVSHLKINECAYMVKKLAKKTEKMIQNNEDWDEIIFTLGQATHYLQDLNCPHHGIGVYREGKHERFETIARYGYWKDDKFDGFHYVVNYKKLAYNAARFSKRYIKYADKLWEDLDSYEKVMTPLWDHTVNDTLDLWLTVLKNGLGEEKYEEFGYPEQVGIRAKKKIKFKKIKGL
jgi:hypothetical protein